MRGDSAVTEFLREGERRIGEELGGSKVKRVVFEDGRLQVWRAMAPV